MPSSLDLDMQVCHAIYSSANALVRAYRPLLGPLGLTYPQYLVMLSLWQRDAVSIRELGQHTRFDAGTLTPILKRLEHKGLLERRHSDKDERKKQICLTRKGKTLKTKAEHIPENMASLLGADYQKAKKLKSLCEELYSAIEEGKE